MQRQGSLVKLTSSEMDWAHASEPFDEINNSVESIDLAKTNEAQTRFTVIDDMIRKVFLWHKGQVKVEEHTKLGSNQGYIDYVLRTGDSTIVIEAKKIGAAFPTPTSKGHLKLNGSVLGKGPISKAIKQAVEYAQTINADLVCVTNGACWCYFSMHSLKPNSSAELIFPFKVDGHAEKLHAVLSEDAVRQGSINNLLDENPLKVEDRLLSVLNNADGRVYRNSIAQHILPALNEALYADALLSNPESLEKCFVSSEGRAKFDAQLGVHLADPRPKSISPAPRIKKGKQTGALSKLVSSKVLDHAPPVTLIIGSVGAGKSTYLKHFELVSGKKLLEQNNAHWIYLDFEEMGREGAPREFIYSKLRDYLLTNSHTDREDFVDSAYKEEILGLSRGPLARIAKNPDELNRRVTDYIQADFEKVEPYVDKLFKYLAASSLCVLVLDNVDLFEDDDLETRVFAEGLAISKRLHINVIVSLRDKTYIRHRNSPTFDASELRQLWLDPPPFKPVLSSRLIYARKILRGKSAQIAFENGMHLSVPDLGVFFEIVQRSVLQGPAGDYVENMADLNIRKGLKLINNFLLSGHIQADRALRSYITEGNSEYYFPFHEVFKGTAISQYKYFKENRSECINMFDSRLGSKRLRLLRVAILNMLAHRAQNDSTLEVPVSDCIESFEKCGANSKDVLEVLAFLEENALVRTMSAEALNADDRVVITRSGGYYLKKLSRKFTYVEQCMYDTAIDDVVVWDKLTALTEKIESKVPPSLKMSLRKDRIVIFVKHLQSLENSLFESAEDMKFLKVTPSITSAVIADADDAVHRTRSS